MTELQRYYVVRYGWFHYVVKCGTGTQVILSSWRRYSAMCFAAELNEAFADGKFVGATLQQKIDFTKN